MHLTLSVDIQKLEEVNRTLEEKVESLAAVVEKTMSQVEAAPKFGRDKHAEEQAKKPNDPGL